MLVDLDREATLNLVHEPLIPVELATDHPIQELRLLQDRVHEQREPDYGIDRIVSSAHGLHLSRLIMLDPSSQRRSSGSRKKEPIGNS